MLLLKLSKKRNPLMMTAVMMNLNHNKRPLQKLLLNHPQNLPRIPPVMTVTVRMRSQNQLLKPLQPNHYLRNKSPRTVMTVMMSLNLQQNLQQKLNQESLLPNPYLPRKSPHQMTVTAMMNPKRPKINQS